MPGETISIVDYVFGDLSDRNDSGIAIVDEASSTHRTWTYGDLLAAIRGTAVGLIDGGLTRGDVVAVISENTAEFVVAYFGVLAAGGVVLPIDPREPSTTWAADIRFCRATTALADKSLWPDPATASLAGARLVRDPFEWSDAEVRRVPGGDRTAVLCGSSGTQGKPKKVVLTHRNLTENLRQIAALHRVHTEDVVLPVGPLRHIYGMQMGMNPTLAAGATLVLGPTPFTGSSFLDLVERRRVSVAYVVPAALADVVTTQPDERDLSSLRTVVSGGAPLPSNIAAASGELLGVPIRQGYGMTEAGCISIAPDVGDARPGSNGVPVPGCEIKLIDPESGEDASANGYGELFVRGPQVTPGYLDDPDATTLLIREGWLRTGDLVTLDHDGFLTVTGRLKSLIKYKGHQISPAELEEILLSHPDITDAAVFGVPDEVAGELPKARIVATSAISDAAVLDYVARRVAPQKRLRLVERVDHIERTDTGKVRVGDLL